MFTDGELSFCLLMKGITPNICRLCVCDIIDKRSFESFMCVQRFQRKRPNNQ